jgi:hypothetical protein
LVIVLHAVEGCAISRDKIYLNREQSLGRKEGLSTTQQETKYALPTQRKILIGQNRCACQSNLIWREGSVTEQDKV